MALHASSRPSLRAPSPVQAARLVLPEGFPSQISGKLEDHLESIRAWAEDKSTGAGGHGVMNQGVTTSAASCRHMRITCDHYGHAKATAMISKKTGCRWAVHIEEMDENGNKISVVKSAKLDHNHSCKLEAPNEDPEWRFQKVNTIGQTLAELARDSLQDYEQIWPALERLEQVAKRQKTVREQASPPMNLPNYAPNAAELENEAAIDGALKQLHSPCPFSELQQMLESSGNGMPESAIRAALEAMEAANKVMFREERVHVI